MAAPKVDLGLGGLVRKNEGVKRALLSFGDLGETDPDDVPKKEVLSFGEEEATDATPAGEKTESPLSMVTLVPVDSSAVTDTTSGAGGETSMLELSALLSSSDSGSDLSEQDL